MEAHVDIGTRPQDPCDGPLSRGVTTRTRLPLISTTTKRTRLRLPNTPKGCEAFLAALPHHRPTWVALETTGTYYPP
jgi:hypothetical protein